MRCRFKVLYIRPNHHFITFQTSTTLLNHLSNNLSTCRYNTVVGNVTDKKLTPKDFSADRNFLLENWQLEILWSSTVAAFVLFGMIGAFTSAKVRTMNFSRYERRQ